MAMSFRYIPNNALVPLFWVETYPAPAPYVETLRSLIIGEARPYHECDYNKPYILDDNNVIQLFGAGSPLANSYFVERANNLNGEIWGIACAQDNTWTPSVWEVEVVNASTSARYGSAMLRAGGKLYVINIKPGLTKDEIAARLAAIINSRRDGYIAAVEINGHKLTVKSKWRGASTNSLYFMHDLYGKNNVASKFFKITKKENGIGEQNIASALAGVGDEQFKVMTLPLVNSVGGQLGPVEPYMDSISGQWSPFRQKYGHVFGSCHATFGSLIGMANARNSEHISVIGAYGVANPPWEWGAALGGVAARRLANPPEISMPLQNIELRGILRPWDPVNQWSRVQQQQLLDAGLAPYEVTRDGRVLLVGVPTMKKTNDYGDPDPNSKWVETQFQAAYFVQSMRQAVTEAFPNAGFSRTGSRINGIASPGKIAAVLVHRHRLLEDVGLVEYGTTQTFARGLVVEPDPLNRHRCNVLMKPQFVAQLRIVAVISQYNPSDFDETLAA